MPLVQITLARVQPRAARRAGQEVTEAVSVLSGPRRHDRTAVTSASPSTGSSALPAAELRASSEAMTRGGVDPR